MCKQLSRAQVGPASNLLVAVDPLHNVSAEKAAAARRFFAGR